MSLSNKLITIGTSILGGIYAAFPFPGVSRPIFIVGCGRSGTTILGKALSKHRDVAYLNEPRHLWYSAYPETDIWSNKAYSRNGKLFLSETDVDPRKSDKLSRLFRFETFVRRGAVLIEKLPINNFRLKFIHQIFPDARFIHLYRNGLEVARSIARLSEKGHWFGANSYKWDKLVDYAMGRDDESNLLSLCTTHFDKGLFEWRLSTECAVAFFSCLPDDAFFEINYDEFMHDPIGKISQVLDYLGLDDDPNVKTFVSHNIARRSSKLNDYNISEKVQVLGGKLLPLSMDSGKGLTRRST